MRMFLLPVYLFLLLIPVGSATVRLSHGSGAHLSNATDQEAMLGFVSAIRTYDPSQPLPTSWKPNVSVCEWTNIIYSGHRVVSLNVSSMGLEGTISPLLGNLSFLVVLDLNNNLHGHIPYQLGRGSINPMLSGHKCTVGVYAHRSNGEHIPPPCIYGPIAWEIWLAIGKPLSFTYAYPQLE